MNKDQRRSNLRSEASEMEIVRDNQEPKSFSGASSSTPISRARESSGIRNDSIMSRDRQLQSSSLYSQSSSVAQDNTPDHPTSRNPCSTSSEMTFVSSVALSLDNLLSETTISEQYHIPPIAAVPKSKDALPAPEGTRSASTDDILGFDSTKPNVKRWISLCTAEKNGDIKFSAVSNDNERCSIEILLAFRNLIRDGLPNMAQYHITRLVFNPRHESTVLLRKKENGNYAVIGGCCYRAFVEQNFVEIAFLVVQARGEGYGSRLMSYVKHRVRDIGVKFLLTCADNRAIPYFEKQGFSSKITLPKDQWQNYIKVYTGITLMECKILDLDYLKMPMVIKAMKMAFVEKRREISSSHVEYPGIDIEGKRGINVDEIPGIENTGWAELKNKTDRSKAALSTLHNHLKSVIQALKKHPSAEHFLEPVDPEKTGAIDYYESIQNPIDLGTIEKRLDGGRFYVTREMFKADVKRMIENCKEYNGMKHKVTKDALKLERVLNKRL